MNALRTSTRSLWAIAITMTVSFAASPGWAVPLGSLPKLLTMGLRNTASEFCSCYFITGRTEERCRDYARINQFTVRFSLDLKSQTVRSRALFDFWPMPSASARFVAATESCQLIED